ncbi:hypothetical protein [Streptomyces lasiicapitis]|uniref:Uncharacterized protein n=1 Tax=Streptomyces lasiicapitis TaxID=1923961 RepID=A0ABQ2MWG4_9ACTN|nr:hypothetical protein [Streptomyces lasiicapitis]GGO58809.1 hypothetical protein GCM10012286_78950 [Streptomyces lasiicapitis]
MRTDRLSRLATRRGLFTGESYDQARAALQQTRALIPEAVGDQQVFETYALRELIRCRYEFTAYTFGIRRVIPRSESLTLHVESEAHAERVLRALLPSHDPTSEVFGITGVRIRQYTDRAIELHRLGQHTSLVLTGPAVSVWKRIEHDKLTETLDRGWEPTWRNRAAWTDAELLFHQEYYTDEWSRRFLRGAWCASALLRRLPVFHQVACADDVSAYIGHPFGAGTCRSKAMRWCFDLDHRPGIAWQDDRLADALSDPDFGLPLRRTPFGIDFYDTAPHMLRLGDVEQTAFVDLRFTHLAPSSLRRGPHAAVVRERVAAAVAKPGEWRPA